MSYVEPVTPVGAPFRNHSELSDAPTVHVPVEPDRDVPKTPVPVIVDVPWLSVAAVTVTPELVAQAWE
jgi:hypothetical protein